MAPGFFAGPCILAETAATTPLLFGGGDDLVKKMGRRNTMRLYCLNLVWALATPHHT